MFILNKAHARAFQGRIQKIPNGGGGVAIFFSEAVVWKNELRGGLPKKKSLEKTQNKQTNKNCFLLNL